MPVTLKTGVMKYRKSDGSYSVMDALMQEPTQDQIVVIGAAGQEQIVVIGAAGQEQIDAVEQKGEEILDSLPQDYTELEGEVTELKSVLDNVEDFESKEMISGSYSGTQALRVNHTFPAGQYHITAESVTSTDTDATTCQLSFCVGNTVKASTLLPRTNSVDLFFLLTSDATSIILNASNTYEHGSGDTFAIDGLKIERSYPLIDGVKNLMLARTMKIGGGFSAGSMTEYDISIKKGGTVKAVISGWEGNNKDVHIAFNYGGSNKQSTTVTDNGHFTVTAEHEYTKIVIWTRYDIADIDIRFYINDFDGSLEQIDNLYTSTYAIENHLDVIDGEVGEIEGEIDNIENLQEKTVLSGTYSGTQSLRVTQEFPAGKYHVLIDSITSSDTDATTCQFGFYTGGTVIAYALFKRAVPIDIYIDLPSKATSIVMLAANNYAKGAGDTFTFSGLKIKSEYPLISAISDLQNNRRITPPSGFSWTDNPLNGHLYRTEDGIICDLDVANLKPAATKTYWVSPDGSDSNTEADSSHPLQSLGAAFAKADVDKIVVMDGFYPVSLAPQHVNGLSRSVSVIAADGAHPVISTNSGSHTWAKTSEKTYVYETGIDSNAVWDIDNAMPYIWVNSVDEVDSTAASFYTDGTKTYVHTKDGSEPSQDIRCCAEADNFHITASGAITLYLEGLSIVGGSSGAFRIACDGTNRAKVYGKNCLFVGATTWGACYLEGVESIMQNCEACYSKADGFGIHRNNETVTVSSQTVEINCRGHHNGIAGNTTSNGSTVHAGGKVIRVNGEYHHNVGPNVADVHNNTESWNLGCHAWTSMRATGGIDFLASDGTAKMWLDNCSAFGSVYSLYVPNSVETYVRNGIFVTVNVVSGGILKSY